MMTFGYILYTLIVILGIVTGEETNVVSKQDNNLIANGTSKRTVADDSYAMIMPTVQAPSVCPPKVWSFYCPTNPSPFIAPMTTSLIDYILKLHNQLRSSVLNPNQTEIPMSWNAELASLSEGNVMQCRVQHDNCAASQLRATAQNLALHSYTGDIAAKDDDELAKAAIYSWWGEYKAGNKQRLGQGKNIAIGCAAARFYQENLNRFLFACTYATLDNFGQLERKQQFGILDGRLAVFS